VGTAEFNRHVGNPVARRTYNISNTPHFKNPSGNISAGGFLAITSALSRSNNVEGGERQFRVALKISF
jgi:hypothetical protein